MKDKRIAIALAIIVYLAVALMLRQILLPDFPGLLVHIQSTYAAYGYELIFFCSLLEGIFIIGMFVPGTAVVMLGATLAGKGVLSLPLVIMSGASGLFCGSLVSYYLGKVGWSKLFPKFPSLRKKLDTAQTWHTRSSWLTFLSFASTGIGAAIATAAGALKIQFQKFALFALITHLFWVSLWASAAYIFGAFIGNTIIAFGGVLALVIVMVAVVQWFVRKKMQ